MKCPLTLEERAKLFDYPHGEFFINMLDRHLARREFEPPSDADGGPKNGGKS